jgi:hypothetical protein
MAQFEEGFVMKVSKGKKAHSFPTDVRWAGFHCLTKGQEQRSQAATDGSLEPN